MDKEELTKLQEKILAAAEKKFINDNFKVVSSLEEAKNNTDGKACYFPGESGIYLYKTLDIGGNKIGTIDKVSKCPFYEVGKEGITSLDIKNKIPGTLARLIIDCFDTVYKKMGTEAAAQVYRKRSTGEYFVYFPKQEVTCAHVSYGKDQRIQTLRVDNELVCELHSHDSMGAFWSGEDDRNETEICFYVVFGNFQDDKLTYEARVKYKDSQIKLKLSDIFDIKEEDEFLKKTSRNNFND